MKLSKTILVLLVTALFLIGCKAEDSEPSIFPDGTYTDNWGYTQEFTDSQWANDTSTFSILERNESGKYMIAQNGANNAYNPSKFSRIDFTKDSNDDLYYCQIAYDKDTAAEAEAVETADANDLTGGCGGFSWSKLTPVS